MNIMRMPKGTIISNKRSGMRYVLGGWANDVARELCNENYAGAIDYINENTQDEYEVVES